MAGDVLMDLAAIRASARRGVRVGGALLEALLDGLENQGGRDMPLGCPDCEMLRDQNERLRLMLRDLQKQRRERIATACMAGLLSDPETGEWSADAFATAALEAADALIDLLDDGE